MTKTHRELFARLGRSGPVPAVLLDTPVGFQENADDLSRRAVAYFRESVQCHVEVASFRSADEVGSVGHETMLNRLRQAWYVFSGPGSPSYALAQWRASQVPEVLAGKLRTGGCITFASAAAVTLGPLALPVYEIYKVGESPHWLPGLDLMAEADLPAVVIPHFDNAEGGTHDTRYCYMGERRLSALEEQLPDDLFILGVDEHTACILDLDAATATVSGRGGVTVRRQGRTERVPAGETLPIETLARLAGNATTAAPVSIASVPTGGASETASPFLGQVHAFERDFRAGVGGGHVRAAAEAVLRLEAALLEWSYDTLQSDERDRARAALRSMIVRLAEVAGTAARDPRMVVEPLVAALLPLRDRARAEGRWNDADAIRDALAAAGVEVRDTPTGTIVSFRSGT
ncbi:MAG: hypothetical protein M3179_11510 [Actinomycetota bacterium]|nr:hypothetical protein [Actinomycetota bacterium]